MKKIGVLVSGGGSNLQAIIDAIKNGKLQTEIGVVISSKPDVFALERAEKYNIPSKVIDNHSFQSVYDFTKAIMSTLAEHQVEVVCLAGFLRILDPVFFETYYHRVLNIHPALLPAFGGKGMYGHHVHEAVLASGARFSGATVHIVTAETDVGPIVIQDIVAIADDDTPETLAAKVLQVEHRIYPQAIKLVLEDQIIVDGLRIRKRL